jgi:hypothetical protein
VFGVGGSCSEVPVDVWSGVPGMIWGVRVSSLVGETDVMPCMTVGVDEDEGGVGAIVQG